MNSDNLIKTNVDRLINLVYEKGTISTKEISLKLNLPEEIIEKWAEILDEDGLIKVEYSKFGGMICKSIDSKAIELKIDGKIKGTEKVKEKIKGHEEKRLKKMRVKDRKRKKSEDRKIIKKIKKIKLKDKKKKKIRKKVKKIRKYKKKRIRLIDRIKRRFNKIFSFKIKRKRSE